MNAVSDTSHIPGPFNLEHFFELSADLFCIAGYDGYFRKINNAVCNALGYTREELLASPIYTFIHPDDRERTAQYRRELVNGVPLLNFENRYIGKNGQVIWLSWTSMPAAAEGLVYAIAKNITHKKKLDEDRNALLDDLTKNNASLKQLNYTTSHDLRSPVNNLLSVFTLMDNVQIQDPEAIKLFTVLRSATGQLQKILSNYIDVLGNKDVLMVKMEPLSMQDSFDRVTASIQALIQTSRTCFDIDFSGAPEVVFNKSYLDSIFLNLITNSIKYAKPDSTPEITIRTTKTDGFIELVFCDKGQGFDLDKVRDKVFGFQKTFHQHADSKGIGLYLVYNHMINLGGTISLDSAPNEGACFTLRFKE